MGSRSPRITGMARITTMANIVCHRLTADHGIISWSAAFFAAADQFIKWHTFCGYLLMLVYNTLMSKITEFYSGLLDKGYTEREINESCKRHQQRVAPDWFNGTYAEYLDSMHEFLNGL